SNEGYINPSVVVGDRMVTEIERITNDIIASKYWGNPEFVLRNLIPHRIKNVFSDKSYGEFYWIRDIAYLSGGYAGAGGVNDVNRYSLWYVR
ncbi:hypothetical protein ELP31_27190, partial [Klebsiella pneumoniae]|nr:hypothetical protein [Klebsiella pneumoniae]